MTVAAHSRLGPYEILSRIGAGGMGEVYRARDTRLDRVVAIKVLPADFAADAQLRLRFDREAKTISQLSHPHICTLHDVGVENGTSYLVMELLEGESLADRLARGPLPMTDVLRIGAQIGEALHAAHAMGVIHRDLKPGNIMLARSGAKLLDFGLAKGGVSRELASPLSATEHKPLTSEGTLIGTFQYMAPEQLEGREADARTDIFALGCVLYEMATGQRAFVAKTRASLIAAIVSGEPRPLRELQPLTPPAFEHVVAQCLQKDPDQRWQSAHDVTSELRWIAQSSGLTSPTIVPRRRTRLLPWLIAAAAIAGAAVPAAMLWRTPEPPRIAASLNPPPETRFTHLGDFGGPIAISPDGRHIAFSAAGKAVPTLWIRSLDSLSYRSVPETYGARFPFWSPDSKSVGFFAAGKLKRVELGGGLPVTLTVAPDPRGGTWMADGTIVFTPDTREGLYRISAEGGERTKLTTIDTATHSTHRWPTMAPDGRHVLYFAGNHSDPLSDRAGIFVVPADGSGKPRRVTHAVSQGVIVGDRLLYVREQTLVSREIGRDFTPKGDATVVAENVLWDPGIWRGGFAVSNTGVLVYHPSGAALTSQLHWVDRTGKTISTIGPPGYYFDVDLSADGKRVAASEGDPRATLYTFDVERGVKTRFTFSDRSTLSPVWSADGSGVFYGQPSEDRSAKSFPRVFYKAWNGTGAGSVVCSASEDRDTIPIDVSRDGRHLLLNAGVPGATDVLYTAVNAVPCRAAPLVATAQSEYDGSFSPDGKWVAYTSDENGRPNVFVTAFPSGGGKWQVSPDGGRLPRWRADGRELYYLTPDYQIVAIDVTSGANDIAFGPPQPLFRVNSRGAGMEYDAAGDGQHFVVNTLTEQTSVPAVVLSDWRRRSP